METNDSKEAQKLKGRNKQRRLEKKAGEKTCCESRKSTGTGEGLNYKALAILAMFALPLLLTGFIFIGDMLNPAGVEQNKIREALVKCYTVADPSKLGSVESLIGKYVHNLHPGPIPNPNLNLNLNLNPNSHRYEGRERELFAKLRTKYHKIPQCISE